MISKLKSLYRSGKKTHQEMKVKELNYHTFLLVLCVSILLGLYTVFFVISGSRSFKIFQVTSATAGDCREPSRQLGTGTGLQNIVFGLAASSELWETRKGYIQSWWGGGGRGMRGAAWFDKTVDVPETERGTVPEIRVSEDTSRFNYTYAGRAPAKRQKPQLRICRIVLETFRLRHPDVHWFVVGDDDTVFIVENLVKVLAKYDHNKMYYIGAVSETHRQNTADPCCSSGMAYGGAGYAISYALAEALEGILDECMERYADLYGGSTRIHACLLELGVPLTREPGFHQLDINGDASGILGAHPIAPLVTLHHLDEIEPLYPGLTRQDSIKHILEASRVDPTGTLQQSLCYITQLNWSVQVSWGWAVQITRKLLSPRILENPIRTFRGWGVPSLDESYTFRTRALPRDTCDRPVMFFMQSVRRQQNGISVSNYTRGPGNECNKRDPLNKLDWVYVQKEPTDDSLFFQAPRRQCCRVVKRSKRSLRLHISDCQKGELTAIQ